MKIYPTKDRVVIRPLDMKEVVGGLEIVRVSKNHEMHVGEVIEAGPDAPFIAEGTQIGSWLSRFFDWLFKINRKPYRIGQKVFYSPASGTTIRVAKESGGREELRIMHADVIQCVIDV